MMSEFKKGDIVWVNTSSINTRNNLSIGIILHVHESLEGSENSAEIFINDKTFLIFENEIFKLR